MIFLYVEFYEFFHSLQGTTVTFNGSKLITSNCYRNKSQSIDITRILSITNTETTNKHSYKRIFCFESNINDLLSLQQNQLDVVIGLQTKPSILSEPVNYFHSIAWLTRTLRKHFSGGKSKWCLIHENLHDSFWVQVSGCT